MNDKAVRDAASKVDHAVERREQARSRLTYALDEDGKAAAFLANANAELEQVVREAALELGLVEPPSPTPCTAPLFAAEPPHVEPRDDTPLVDDTPF